MLLCRQYHHNARHNNHVTTRSFCSRPKLMQLACEMSEECSRYQGKVQSKNNMRHKNVRAILEDAPRDTHAASPNVSLSHLLLPKCMLRLLRPAIQQGACRTYDLFNEGLPPLEQ